MAAAKDKEPGTPTQRETAAATGSKEKGSPLPRRSAKECKDEAASPRPQADIWWSCSHKGCSYQITTSTKPRNRSSMKLKHIRGHKLAAKTTRVPANAKKAIKVMAKKRKITPTAKTVKKDKVLKVKKGKALKPRSAKPKAIKPKVEVQPRKKAKKPMKPHQYSSRQRLLRAVWDGKLKKTARLTKDDLCISHRGRIVPKRRSAHSKKLAASTGWAENWRNWCRAHAEIRKEHGIKTFLKVKKDGSALQKDMYLRVLERWAETKAASITKTLTSAGSRISYKLSDGPHEAAVTDSLCSAAGA